MLEESAMARRFQFERALKCKPAYAEAHNNLGVVYYIQKNYKKAIKQYQRHCRWMTSPLRSIATWRLPTFRASSSQMRSRSTVKR